MKKILVELTIDETLNDSLTPQGIEYMFRELFPADEFFDVQASDYPFEDGETRYDYLEMYHQIEAEVDTQAYDECPEYKMPVAELAALAKIIVDDRIEQRSYDIDSHDDIAGSVSLAIARYLDAKEGDE